MWVALGVNTFYSGDPEISFILEATAGDKKCQKIFRSGSLETGFDGSPKIDREAPVSVHPEGVKIPP